MNYLGGVAKGETYYKELKANGLRVFQTNGDTHHALETGQIKLALIQSSAGIGAGIKVPGIKTVTGNTGSCLLGPGDHTGTFRNPKGAYRFIIIQARPDWDYPSRSARFVDRLDILRTSRRRLRHLPRIVNQEDKCDRQKMVVDDDLGPPPCTHLPNNRGLAATI